MKILFVPCQKDATAFYRCEVPAKFLMKRGYEVRVQLGVEGGSYIRDKTHVEWADVIICQRPYSVNHAKRIKQLKKLYPKKPFFIEFDDDYENVPTWNQGYQFINARKGEWKDCVAQGDAILVSTDKLKDLMREHGFKVPVFVIKNGMDLDLILGLKPLESHKIELPVPDETGERFRNNEDWTWDDFEEFRKDKVVLSWFGSRTHYGDVDLVPEELLEAQKKHEDLLVMFVGYASWRVVVYCQYGRFFLANPASPALNYYRLLKLLRPEISISPVQAIKFNQSKSAIKVYESMLVKSFPIASDFYTYCDDIHEGFLAGYEEGDWFRAIDEAVTMYKEDRPEFDRRVESNFDYVKSQHYAALRSSSYIDAFEKMIKAKSGEK